MTTTQQSQHQRRLWQEEDETDSDGRIDDSSNNQVESIDELQRRFSTKPPLRSFVSLCQSTLVVGQEFVLVAYFLARHQQTRLNDNKKEQPVDSGEIKNEDMRQLISHLFVLLALLLVLVFNNETRHDNIAAKSSTATSQSEQLYHKEHPRRVKVKQRSMDALLLALLLRLLASVLRTLTESFSSDTVHALANAGLMLHLLTCDYAYANGLDQEQDVASTKTMILQKRPAFLGGTVSLNAAFFSTTLLASRLSSNSTVYVFVSLSVVLFAFYPAARHGVSKHDRGPLVHLFILALLLVATLALLPTVSEAYLLASVLGTVCILAPAWKFYMQRHKQIISGPWDVAKLQNMIVEDEAIANRNLKLKGS